MSQANKERNSLPIVNVFVLNDNASWIDQYLARLWLCHKSTTEKTEIDVRPLNFNDLQPMNKDGMRPEKRKVHCPLKERFLFYVYNM